MSPDQPFGFGTGNDDEGDDRPVPSGGLPGFGFGGAGGFDMSQLGDALQQLGRMLSQQPGDEQGSVNWSLAHDSARAALATAGDPSVGDAQRRATEAAVDLAQLWLDEATTFPATAGAYAWSRSEWLEATLPSWHRVVDPIAERVQEATAGLMPGPGESLPEGLPPELAAMAGPMLGQLSGMAKAMGASMFGAQVGQALAALAGEVLGAGDVGIPLTETSTPALLPRNVTEFGEGLSQPADQVLLYAALREAAQQRLFAHVPWLRPRLAEAVESYARGVTVDRSRIEEAAREIDPSRPESLQELLSSGVLVPEDTPQQRAALVRLETLLALVEGWVDDVVSQAAGDRLPGSVALAEAVRRRRASGGPAEKVFATLVGLELRPRRMREAAQLWTTLRTTRGLEARDALWAHPDLLPNGEDLDDVDGFMNRSAPLDLSGLTDLPPAPDADESE